MRDDIVEDRNQASVFVFAHLPCNCAEAWSHKGQPKLGDHQVGFQSRNLASDFAPIEWIVRMHFSYNVKVLRRGFGAVLCLSWEEEVGVLMCKCVDYNLMTHTLVLAGKPLVESGKSTAVGVCCTENDDFHRINFRSAKIGKNQPKNLSSSIRQRQ